MKHQAKQHGKLKKSGGKKVHHIKTLPDRQKHQKLEIKFDPEARRNYLTGFSKEKKERRIFGLAMGKVKERKLKLESRKEEREAINHQIEEAERNKRIERGDYISDDDDDEDDNSNTNMDVNGDSETKDEMITFKDQVTEELFGSHVVVTTSYGLPSSEDESGEDDIHKKPKKGNNDRRQQYAGSVKKFIDKFSKQMPAKKKRTDQKAAKKGQHGASKMIGGSASDLKSAKKFLSRAQQNQKGTKGGDGKKKKRR